MDAYEVDIDAALQVAINTAKEAGKVVLEGYYATKTVETKTAFYDLVTEYDKKTEDLVISEIKKTFPTHKFIGEESATKNPILTNEPSWIIDPIDGTTNYIHGYPEACISIGLAVNKDLKVGVIYNPITDNLYTASKGRGAFQNGKRIYVSKCTEMRNALIAMELSFACMPHLRDLVIERFRNVVSEAHGVRALGSAALTLCYVANGNLDAFQQDDLQCWDVAAGVLLVKEAGGIVIGSDGKAFEVMTRKLLATSTQPLADAMVEKIKDADTRSQQL